uniref:Uncharacterized protein n=1 Tax=Strigamia maritima TaxID=126957 RepID=T1J091_STRMM
MESSGKVRTVTGPIEPSKVGVTLTHEHMNLVFDVAHVPALENEKELMNLPFCMENLGWIRQNPYSHKDNLIFNDDATKRAVIEDVIKFKNFGGGTIVENTTHGLQRDLEFMKKVANDTGINIVAGTGFYISAAQTPNILSIKMEEIADLMRNEIINGCDGIKCGVIGELGCSWPLHGFEKKNLSAAAIVQEELNAPVMIHPGRHHEAPSETLRYFLEAGGKASKTVMAHLDRSIFDNCELVEFAKMGSYCEFDLFGIEVSIYQLNDSVDMISDAERISKLTHLIEEGFEDKIVISHDIHTKHRLTNFGGNGYSHILRYVVPQMKNRKFTQTIINKILIQNPTTWLSF